MSNVIISRCASVIISANPIFENMLHYIQVVYNTDYCNHHLHQNERNIYVQYCAVCCTKLSVPLVLHHAPCGVC